MRILIADDHAMLRGGLKQILALEFAGAIFGEVGTYQETMSQVDKEPWDVLVLDIFMPARSGLDVLRELDVIKPELPELVLSSAPEEQMAPRVLRAGVAGYSRSAGQEGRQGGRCREGGRGERPGRKKRLQCPTVWCKLHHMEID